VYTEYAYIYVYTNIFPFRISGHVYYTRSLYFCVYSRADKNISRVCRYHRLQMWRKTIQRKSTVSRKSVHTSSAHVEFIHVGKEKAKKKKVKKKEWEERKNSSAVVHARTHARTGVFPACIDERSNRRSQLATRVDRCETGSDELTLANEFANLFRSFRFAIIVRICVSLTEIYWKIMINYLICI